MTGQGGTWAGGQGESGLLCQYPHCHQVLARKGRRAVTQAHGSVGPTTRVIPSGISLSEVGPVPPPPEREQQISPVEGCLQLLAMHGAGSLRRTSTFSAFACSPPQSSSSTNETRHGLPLTKGTPFLSSLSVSAGRRAFFFLGTDSNKS